MAVAITRLTPLLIVTETESGHFPVDQNTFQLTHADKSDTTQASRRVGQKWATKFYRVLKMGFQDIGNL